jgi:hypothetical protein
MKLFLRREDNFFSELINCLINFLRFFNVPLVNDFETVLNNELGDDERIIGVALK